MVCILLADGFEEAEALVTADLLRRGGCEVLLTGVSGPNGHRLPPDHRYRRHYPG